MRIWDSELLAANKPDVVRNGLLSWIDFQDRVTVTSSITPFAITGTIADRITGNTVEIKSDKSANHKYIWFDQANKFLVLHPTNATTYNKGIYLPSSITNCKSIEFVYRNAGEGNKSQQYIANRVAYNTSTSQNLLYFFNNTSNSLTNSLIGGANPVHVYIYIGSGSKANVYLNGTLVKSGMSAGGATFESSTVLMLIGLKGTTETQSCMIGSVRLYNRALTLAELNQNIQYEVKMGRLSS